MSIVELGSSVFCRVFFLRVGCLSTRKIEQKEKSMSQVVEHWNEESDRNSKNFLWNYCNNAANLLKTSIYQLAPTTSNDFDFHTRK